MQQWQRWYRQLNTNWGGTLPNTFNWGGGITTEDRTGLTAGSYSVTITDANGCTGTVNVTVTQPTVLSSSLRAQTNVSCNGGTDGSATVSATGGTSGYTYSWSPSGGTGATATGLATGTYTVTVTDANGCTAKTSVTITEPTAIDSTVGLSAGVLTANATGASYQWYACPNTLLECETNQTFTPTVAGDYKVVITSSENCWMTSECVTVTTLGVGNIASNDPKLVLYPNPAHETIQISGLVATERYSVYNTLGEVVFEGSISNKEEIRVQDLSDGMYFIAFGTHVIRFVKH